MSPSPLVRSAEAQHTDTASSFEALCEEHAPKLKVIRDMALGAAPNIHDNDHFKFRKMWIYFGNISPALFDLQPAGKGKAKQLFPGFCAEALKHSLGTDSRTGEENHHFEIINIAERAAAGNKKMIENDFDTVLRTLDTPHGGQITRPQIHAFRRFIHGSSKPEFDKHLKFDGRTDALISVLHPDHTVTHASAYVDAGSGWTLAAFNAQARPAAAQLPAKVKRFIEFLADLKIVAMKPKSTAMWYQVPQKDGVIFLSANVNACLDATPIDNLKKIINHDLNCTGAIVRIICGDEKMGGVGLSLNHIGVSVLADVPDSVTAMDQAARRGNRMCSHRGLPTLPTDNTRATNLAHVSDWTVRLVILASGIGDKVKLQNLKDLQRDMISVETQLNTASTHTLRGKSFVSNNIPLSHSKLMAAVQSPNNLSKISNVQSQLKRLYRLNPNDALRLLQEMLGAAATKGVNNQLANADKKLIEKWVYSVQRAKSEEDFNALARVALHAKKRNQYHDLNSFLTNSLREAAREHLAKYVNQAKTNLPQGTWAHGWAVRVFRLIRNAPNSPPNNIGNPFFAASSPKTRPNANMTNKQKSNKLVAHWTQRFKKEAEAAAQAAPKSPTHAGHVHPKLRLKAAKRARTNGQN